ncbi:hypothetical protein MPSEU_000183800 [Mayamaea pseudoterrestris]|nr:hypothetical protein MPSEU_000183800 [Mayamaea pseudoterrestris]
MSSRSIKSKQSAHQTRYVNCNSTTRAIAVLFFFTGAVICNNNRRLGLIIETNSNNNSLRQLNSKPKLKPMTTIHLLGERHSGTKWMTAHLTECFANNKTRVRVVSALSRWKHWFQENGAYASRSSIVVAQFRDVHQWVEAMRINPYHAPNHFNLTWKDFVTQPWTMERYGRDRELYAFANNSTQDFDEPTCQYRFRPFQAIPCHEDSTIRVTGFRPVASLYELRNDGSGQPYDNILQLRADKIRHFLSIANFISVQHFESVRYEDMVQQGTASLIQTLEKVLGVKAQCQPTAPQQSLSSRPVPREYMEWMQNHVDWEAERLIGYGPQLPVTTAIE